MIYWLLSFSSLLSLVSAVLSDCLNGIQTAATLFPFTNSSTEGYYASLCQDDLSLTSMWAAAKLYRTTEEITIGSALLEYTCIVNGYIDPVPYEDFLPKLTDSFIDSLPIVNFEDIGNETVYKQTILISKSLFEIGVRTYVSGRPRCESV